MKLMKVVMETQEVNNKLLIEQNKEEENKASLDGGLFVTTSSETAMSNIFNGMYFTLQWTLQCLKKLSQMKRREINW